MKSRNLLFLTFLIVFGHPAAAQRITGSWKRTGNMLVNADGSKNDLQKTIVQSMPCSAGVKYIFEEGGKHYTKSPKGCEMIDEISTATWTQTGNTLSIHSNAENDIGTVYTLSFSGNTVVFTHVYSEAEKSRLHIKTAKIIITYQRV